MSGSHRLGPRPFMASRISGGIGEGGSCSTGRRSGGMVRAFVPKASLVMVPLWQASMMRVV